MKKTACILLLFLLLVSCGKREETVVIIGNAPVEEIPEEVLRFSCEHMKEEGTCELGTGIALIEMTEAGIVPSEDTFLFPLFYDGKLEQMILLEGEGCYVEEMDRGMNALIGTPFFAVKSGHDVCLITKGEISLLFGSDCRQVDNREEVKMLQEGETMISPLGRNRTLIHKGNREKQNVTDPETGISYSSSRIVITFTEGDREEKIKRYERFCNGSLRSEMKQTGLCVFSFESLSYEALNALREDSLKLDYVRGASLDRQSDVPKDPRKTDR